MFDVPRATIVSAVAPDRPSEIVLLRLDWQAPVVLHQSCSDFSVRAMGKHLWRTLARAFDAKKCFPEDLAWYLASHSLGDRIVLEMLQSQRLRLPHVGVA